MSKQHRIGQESSISLLWRHLIAYDKCPSKENLSKRNDRCLNDLISPLLIFLRGRMIKFIRSLMYLHTGCLFKPIHSSVRANRKEQARGVECLLATVTRETNPHYLHDQIRDRYLAARASR